MHSLQSTIGMCQVWIPQPRLAASQGAGVRQCTCTSTKQLQVQGTRLELEEFGGALAGHLCCAVPWRRQEVGWHRGLLPAPRPRRRRRRRLRATRALPSQERAG